MRVFVTGASGWIGSAVVPELIGAGHRVLGLARSDTSAAAIASMGAEVLRGSLDDLDSLRTGAAESDGVIHLAYIHDFSQIEAAAQTNMQAIETFGAALEGSGRPVVIASGTPQLGAGRIGTEEDGSAPSERAHPRVAAEAALLSFASRRVRPSVLRLPPTVHGAGDHGFMAVLVDIARRKGVSGYIGDGSNHWPAVHRLDAARLFRLAVESAPAGSVLHGVAEQGIPTRVIAETVGRNLALPVASIGQEVAGEHFDWLAMFFGLDVQASSDRTRQRFGWTPTQPGLIEDLDAGHYFTRSSEVTTG
jgi:nucleoside-diphosphate-sugar epimerase